MIYDDPLWVWLTEEMDEGLEMPFCDGGHPQYNHSFDGKTLTISNRVTGRMFEVTDVAPVYPDRNIGNPGVEP